MYIQTGSSETTREAPYTTQKIIVKNFTFHKQILPKHKKNIDISFLEWFVGFSEGDGYFCSRIQDNRVRLSFEILQKDAKLMYKIRTTLGFGKVSCFTRTNETYWKYSVEDKKGLQRIMLLFNGNFVLPKKYEQFAYWVSIGKTISPLNFSLKLQRVQVSLKTGWLSGFIEAEGCFYANFKAKQKFELENFSFDQKLTITQKNTHGESVVLQEITVLFESVVKLRIAKKPNYYRIEFCSLKAHTIIIAYLNEFPLLGKKNIVFHRWWRIYLRRKEPRKKQITLKTIEKLKKLCSMINQH